MKQSKLYEIYKYEHKKEIILVFVVQYFYTYRIAKKIDKVD